MQFADKIRKRSGVSWWLAGVLILYVAASVFINPLREYAFLDDWAYALTVRRLIETGIFRTHDFLGPNALFPAFWGAFFSRLFGYSLSILHLSTVILMGLALIALYMLARDHGLSPMVASIVTLVMLASPLVLEFSFTFMTDAPFLALVTIALALYTRGLKGNNLLAIAAGSFAAGCAVLTRQFGVAFVPGLLFTWWFSHQRKALVVPFALTMLGPIAATVYQGATALTSANWSGHWMGVTTIRYLLNPGVMIPETFWRLAITLAYVAFFCLPLIVPAAAKFIEVLRQTDRDSSQYRLNATLLIALPLWLLTTLLIGSLALGKPGTMPFLPWNFDQITHWPRPLMALLTLTVVAGAFLFGRIFILHHLPSSPSPDRTHEHLLSWTTLFLVFFQLLLFQFGDEYLLHLIPFTLIIVGRSLLDWIERLAGPLIALALALLVINALWVRSVMSSLEAYWVLGSRLIDQGIDPHATYASAWEWNSYQGAFDEYLESIHYADGTEQQYGPYFYQYLPARQQTARYLITPLGGGEDLSGWVVVDQVTYQDGLLRTQTVYTLERQP